MSMDSRDDQVPAPTESPSDAILVLAAEILRIANENAIPVAEAAAKLLIAATVNGDRRLH